eukprot:scaffold9941_cov116-Isochrysis_galbana.AAC.13
MGGKGGDRNKRWGKARSLGPAGAVLCLSGVLALACLMPPPPWASQCARSHGRLLPPSRNPPRPSGPRALQTRASLLPFARLTSPHASSAHPLPTRPSL